MKNLLCALLLLAAAAAQGQSVTVSPTPQCTWCDIYVIWSGVSAPSGTDRLALTTPSSTTFINWRYTNGAASGTLLLNIPGGTPFGNYVVRFYSGSTNIATSAQFQAVPSISGTITSGGTGLSGVNIAATSGASCNPVTGAPGHWGCLIPVGWSGTVTPSKPGVLFTPASRSYSNVPDHIGNSNFATAATHAVSGTITRGGAALSGVAIAGSNGASCTSTNASGQYTCAVLPGWSGTVTPTLAGNVFTPASRSYSNVTAAQSAQNYTASYPITGTVSAAGSPLSGVAMGATGGVTCTNSDGSGNYTCLVSPGWSGTVTPTLSATTFTPASRSYSNVNAAQSAQHYQVSQTVSGTVTAGGLPLGGVGVTASNGGTCTATNSSGQYACTVLKGWSGVVTPALSGYTFTPSSRSYSNLTTDQTAQDYTSAVNTSAARIFYIEVDHLNTPRRVADATGTPVWRWDQQEPFGVTVPDENPSSLGAFEFPLRYPGQYADKETNLFYNYFRDYDSVLGRYVQSDPIGLRGGINTYAYVESKPLLLIDPLGLQGGPYPPPPADVPGGPWSWAPDSNNSRGGSYVGKNGASASWDSPGDHWDVDDGKGNRQRYNRWGKPITPQQAHNYRGPKQRPLRGPSVLMCIPLYFSYCDNHPEDPACRLGKNICDANPDLCI